MISDREIQHNLCTRTHSVQSRNPGFPPEYHKAALPRDAQCDNIEAFSTPTLDRGKPSYVEPILEFVGKREEAA